MTTKTSGSNRYHKVQHVTLQHRVDILKQCLEEGYAPYMGEGGVVGQGLGKCEEGEAQKVVHPT